MQGRLIDERCYFACDHPGCKAALHTTAVIWTRAVAQAHADGWYTAISGPGKYKHLCPEHAKETK